jgi:hypothetical protein
MFNLTRDCRIPAREIESYCAKIEDCLKLTSLAKLLLRSLETSSLTFLSFRDGSEASLGRSTRFCSGVHEIMNIDAEQTVFQRCQQMAKTKTLSERMEPREFPEIRALGRFENERIWWYSTPLRKDQRENII